MHHTEEMGVQRYTYDLNLVPRRDLSIIGHIIGFNLSNALIVRD